MGVRKKVQKKTNVNKNIFYEQLGGICDFNYRNLKSQETRVRIVSKNEIVLHVWTIIEYYYYYYYYY